MLPQLSLLCTYPLTFCQVWLSASRLYASSWSMVSSILDLSFITGGDHLPKVLLPLLDAACSDVSS